MSSAPCIAVIGDLHSCWDDADARYFNQSRYDKIFVTGDLGSSGAKNGVKVARSLARLERDTLVMLGNNDADEYARITAELNYQTGRADLLSNLDSASEPDSGRQRVQACGFSAHQWNLGELDVTVIAARPFAMGGGQLSFPKQLAASFRIPSLEASTERLKELVDQARSEHLLFLAHNGPYGLGDHAAAPYGRDFHPDQGDWGDQDLSEAILHAQRRQRRVLAVVAGHMHWFTRGGGQRKWLFERDGTLYLNPARVPRHVQAGATLRRHHIALSLTPERARAEEVWVLG